MRTQKKVHTPVKGQRRHLGTKINRQGWDSISAERALAWCGWGLGFKPQHYRNNAKARMTWWGTQLSVAKGQEETKQICRHSGPRAWCFSFWYTASSSLVVSKTDKSFPQGFILLKTRAHVFSICLDTVNISRSTEHHGNPQPWLTCSLLWGCGMKRSHKPPPWRGDRKKNVTMALRILFLSATVRWERPQPRATGTNWQWH